MNHDVLHLRVSRCLETVMENRPSSKSCRKARTQLVHVPRSSVCPDNHYSGDIDFVKHKHELYAMEDEPGAGEDWAELHTYCIHLLFRVPQYDNLKVNRCFWSYPQFHDDIGTTSDGLWEPPILCSKSIVIVEVRKWKISTFCDYAVPQLI